MITTQFINPLTATAYAIAQADSALPEDPTTVTLSAGGWFMMSASILMVCGLSAFCLYRILREPAPSGHHHAPLDIDTGDK